jgi:hypothetical protein
MEARKRVILRNLIIVGSMLLTLNCSKEVVLPSDCRKHIIKKISIESNCHRRTEYVGVRMMRVQCTRTYRYIENTGNHSVDSMAMARCLIPSRRKLYPVVIFLPCYVELSWKPAFSTTNVCSVGHYKYCTSTLLEQGGC